VVSVRTAEEVAMATTLSRGQQIGGAVSVVTLLLLIGVIVLVGGTAGGWFSGAENEAAQKKQCKSPCERF